MLVGLPCLPLKCLVCVLPVLIAASPGYIPGVAGGGISSRWIPVSHGRPRLSCQLLSVSLPLTSKQNKTKQKEFFKKFQNILSKD